MFSSMFSLINLFQSALLILTFLHMHTFNKPQHFQVHTPSNILLHNFEPKVQHASHKSSKTILQAGPWLRQDKSDYVCMWPAHWDHKAARMWYGGCAYQLFGQGYLDQQFSFNLALVKDFSSTKRNSFQCQILRTFQIESLAGFFF